MSDIKHKFTKCECCPYYACIKDSKTNNKKWGCSRFKERNKCVYDFDLSLNYETRLELVKLWINANKEVSNEQDNKEIL